MRQFKYVIEFNGQDPVLTVTGTITEPGQPEFNRTVEVRDDVAIALVELLTVVPMVGTDVEVPA
jgi:hypothetical protein